MHKRKYPLRLHTIVNGIIPQPIHAAMRRCGWDAFYIYELVKHELSALEKEKTNEDD